MFSQRRAGAALPELSVKTVLEIRVSIVRRPVAVGQAGEQEEDRVEKKKNRRRPISVNHGGRIKKKRAKLTELPLSPAHTL